MARRQFRDSNGTQWNVWDVVPDDALGAFMYDRRARTRGTPADGVAAIPLDPALERGWLCFQTGEERRRFAPIPPNWDDLPDGVLRVMLDIANRVSVSAPPADGPARMSSSE